MIPVGARYKQLGRPTHFRSGHQNPINEASLMVVGRMVALEIRRFSNEDHLGFIRKYDPHPTCCKCLQYFHIDNLK